MPTYKKQKNTPQPSTKANFKKFVNTENILGTKERRNEHEQFNTFV